jgi:hypothetical protein
MVGALAQTKSKSYEGSKGNQLCESTSLPTSLPRMRHNGQSTDINTLLAESGRKNGYYRAEIHPTPQSRSSNGLDRAM